MLHPETAARVAALLCDLEGPVRRLIQAAADRLGRRVRTSEPRVFTPDAADEGELLGENAARVGIHVHNGTDGTILLSPGTEPAEVRRYAVAVGPGNQWHPEGALASYTGAWTIHAVTEAEAEANGTLAPVTAGSVAVIDLYHETAP